MIDRKIINIASNTKFYGLKDNFTHKSRLKNITCGDKISIEIILNRNIIKGLRYETEACIMCQASASLLAELVKNKDINKTKEKIMRFNFKYSNNITNKKLKYLFNKKFISRKECVLLPFKAFLKAVK